MSTCDAHPEVTCKVDKLEIKVDDMNKRLTALEARIYGIVALIVFTMSFLGDKLSKAVGL